MMNKISNVRQFEQPFGEKKRLVERQSFIHIAILATIILAIGIYLISTTVLIARDGTFYIGYAQKMANNPIEAVRNSNQPPGYSFLIYLMHKVTGLFNDTESIQSWITSAQAVSLLSKVIASVALYFIGSYFAGPGPGFWGVLILSILPIPSKYGSDVLSEWSYIMFLSMGFLLLLLSVRFDRWWMFCCTGIVTGLGFLVRHECCQLIIYGGVWLSFNIIRPQEKTTQAKAVKALISLLAGFAVIGVPYMRYQGYIFPEQQIWKLPTLLSVSTFLNSTHITNVNFAGFSVRTIGGKMLIADLFETLMYYFAPALLIGSYYYFRKQSKTLKQTFFATAFIVGNIAISLWQASYRGFLSRRHTLALVALTAFYIPIGLFITASFLSERSSKNDANVQKNSQRWFFILLAIGVAICLPKLFRPIRIEKQGYIAAATWLRENTAKKDLVAVPDKRIGFYAERENLEYDKNIPKETQYVVEISEDNKERLTEKEWPGAKKVFSMVCDHNKTVAIYDLRDYISEKLRFIEYHCEKIADEKYKFSFRFEVKGKLEKDWTIFLYGRIKDEDASLLLKNHQIYKPDNWDFSPQPATSTWPENEYVTITHEISAKPIPHYLRLGFYRDGEGQYGRTIHLGWVNLGDIKECDGK